MNVAGVSYRQAVAASANPTARFHYVGAAGHDICSEGIEEFRSNGRCKTWVTRPGHFALPVKRGLRDTDTIRHQNAHHWHHVDDCPELRSRNEEALHLVIGHKTGEHDADKRKPGWDEEE